MQGQGVMPDPTTHRALISTCGRGEQTERELELFKIMQRKGVVPDTITYNALISTCEKGRAAMAGARDPRDYAGARRDAETNHQQRLGQYLRKGRAAGAGAGA